MGAYCAGGDIARDAAALPVLLMLARAFRALGALSATAVRDILA
jgi:hypothetical protein